MILCYYGLVWPYMGCWSGSGCPNMACYWVSMFWYGPIWDAGVAVAASYGLQVWLWLPYYGMILSYCVLVWPYRAWWCGGGCLTSGAGGAVAVLIWHAIELLYPGMVLYGMLVWRWQPNMGCLFGSGCPNRACYWVIMSWYGPICDAGVAVAPLHGMLVWR